MADAECETAVQQWKQSRERTCQVAVHIVVEHLHVLSHPDARNHLLLPREGGVDLQYTCEQPSAKPPILCQCTQLGFWGSGLRA